MNPALPLAVRRSLLFEPKVLQQVQNTRWPRALEDKSATPAKERRRVTHALINNFVRGDSVAPDVSVKALTAKIDLAFTNLIELRSGPPNPQSRLFVYVYCPGTWIVLKFASRDELGNLGDPRWSAAAKECKSLWLEIFGSRKPYVIKFPIRTFAELRALTDG